MASAPLKTTAINDFLSAFFGCIIMLLLLLFFSILLIDDNKVKQWHVKIIIINEDQVENLSKGVVLIFHIGKTSAFGTNLSVKKMWFGDAACKTFCGLAERKGKQMSNIRHVLLLLN